MHRRQELRQELKERLKRFIKTINPEEKREAFIEEFAEKLIELGEAPDETATDEKEKEILEWLEKKI